MEIFQVESAFIKLSYFMLKMVPR